MILDDAKFERIESKIVDIQRAIDSGIVASDFDGRKALAALRETRTELFKLREIINASIEIEPTRGPDSPAAA